MLKSFSKVVRKVYEDTKGEEETLQSFGERFEGLRLLCVTTVLSISKLVEY